MPLLIPPRGGRQRLLAAVQQLPDGRDAPPTLLPLDAERPRPPPLAVQKEAVASPTAEGTAGPPTMALADMAASLGRTTALRRARVVAGAADEALLPLAAREMVPPRLPLLPPAERIMALADEMAGLRGAAAVPRLPAALRPPLILGRSRALLRTTARPPEPEGAGEVVVTLQIPEAEGEEVVPRAVETVAMLLRCAPRPALQPQPLRGGAPHVRATADGRESGGEAHRQLGAAPTAVGTPRPASPLGRPDSSTPRGESVPIPPLRADRGTRAGAGPPDMAAP